MDRLKDNVGQKSAGKLSKPSFFTFVPAVQKLPIKHVITEEEARYEALTRNTNKTVATRHQEPTRWTMSDQEHFKAERVFFIKSLDERMGKPTPVEQESKSKPPSDHMSFSQTPAASSVSAQSENTTQRYASMVTAAGTHRDISQTQCHDTPRKNEVSLGYFSDKAKQSEERMSPTNYRDLFPTPASSSESILSECSDKVAFPSITSPFSLSRTVSPCSSVRSGLFSPAVVPIKRHFLAPGSSLINISQTCFSSCESLSSSSCPQSPPPRHRPPLTRLSLLTAILRKGRLPVLSSELPRPYTPCWPVNPVTLSFCNACSAASSVASIPLEFSSRFSSSTSIDSQSDVHREAHRCTTAPPLQDSSSQSKTPLKRFSDQIRPSSAPKWERAFSPPPKKSSTLARVPLPQFSSNIKSISSPKRETRNNAIPQKLSNTNIDFYQTPEQISSGFHNFNKDSLQSNPRKGIPSATNRFVEPDPPAPKKLIHKPNSSLSKLHSLSQRLRSSPVYPSHLQPSRSCASISSAVSPLSPVQNVNRISGGSCLHIKSAMHSEGLPKSHSPSPSCYTPVVFSGWLSPSNTPTPTPSPAPTVRDLTPSPLLSLPCSPSPRPGSGISDCSDGEGKKRKTHKIKSSYKSFAAIPTNTLLQDQQVIDEQVERRHNSCGRLDEGVDTHALMCSPAELRQQSDELYAAIDDILATSIPESSRSTSTKPVVQQNKTHRPKLLGRETKYASLCSLHPSAERKLMHDEKTKPGITRPMTAIPRLTLENEDEFHLDRFKQPTLHHKHNTMGEIARPEQPKIIVRKGKLWSEEMKPQLLSSYPACDLQITETKENISDTRKDVLTTFSPTDRHI
ncbi:muscular LMNA-interacting protein [Gouania willdenowi]|uniref:Muscular LMNA-interacting protein n=1 Tax=Gouania willdenowi TaxID=441366 RepID=A0A8C5HH81_GOUWI|nr:muscular LMNA-interacting protein [Gouania willdenowi]